jgi:hypothetical protein
MDSVAECLNPLLGQHVTGVFSGSTLFWFQAGCAEFVRCCCMPANSLAISGVSVRQALSIRSMVDHVASHDKDADKRTLLKRNF